MTQIAEAVRMKIAIAGAGREALELLSILCRDKDISITSLMDTSKDVIGFRLKDYGYAYSSDLKFRQSHRLRDLTTIQDLNLVIDTEPERFHRDLYNLNIYPSEIMNGHVARFIWELKNIEDIERRRSLITEKLPGLVEDIDRGLQGVMDVRSFIDEYSAVLLRAAFLGTHAAAVQLTVLGNNKPPDIISDLNMNEDLFIRPARHRPYIHDRGEAGEIMRHVVENRNAWGATGGTTKGWDAVSAMPLMDEPDVAGLLWLYYDAPSSSFMRNDTDFISSVMLLFGKTIRSSKESRGSRFAYTEEALAVKPFHIIGSEKPIGTKLKEVNSSLLKLLGAEDAHLYIKDPATGDLVMQATTHKFPYLLGRIRVRKGHGVLGEIMERGRPVILAEAEINGNGQAHPYSKRDDEITLFYLPLVVKEKGVGLIAMEFIDTRNMVPAIHNTLVNIGKHLANTISSDVERYRMTQKIIKLSTVNEEGIEILSTTDLQKVLALATITSAMLLDSEVAILRLSEGEGLAVKSTYGLQEDKAAQTLLDLDSNISDMVLQTGVPALIHDVLEYTEIASEEDFPFKTAISVPIMFNKELLGTLSLYNKAATDTFSSIFFTEDDREIQEHFTHYVSRGIINARRYNENQSLITIDGITGLRNERYLQMRFPEEIKRAGRFDRRLSLIFFEVKPVDDSQILEIAAMVQETFRYIDVIVRLKEAKFAVLLPDTGEGVKDATKRLSSAFNRLREKKPGLTLLAGYSTYPDDGEEMQELIKKASKLRQY